jgi:hypothetical protein
MLWYEDEFRNGKKGKRERKEDASTDVNRR